MTDKKNPTLSAVWDLWREVTRPEIIITIEDIISAIPIKSRDDTKPIVCHHNPTETGWHVVLNVPVGLSSEDITQWLSHFEEHLDAYIEADINGSKVHLRIYTVPLPLKVPYNFNPKDYPEMLVPIPIGIGYKGLVVVDLTKLPHLFLAGTTGSGKTTEIKVIIDALINQGVGLSLIDLKGLDYGYLENHIDMAEDMEAAAAMLASVKREMRRRVKILRRHDCESWVDYKGDDLPYMVLVVDELAEFKDDESYVKKPKQKSPAQAAQETLESLVRLCRAAGISIIGACQRPSAKAWRGGDFREIISLFDARICYRTVDNFNSEIVLGKGNSAAYDHIKLEERGRGIWKCNGETLVQSMFIPKSQLKNNLPVVKKHDSQSNGNTKPDARFKPK